ncbi:hypothetical protein [Synechococcus sp. PCC 6312]|uniref:hypothetical protein n=1 Tax=Synechococcus sp. (strain ATCC 27167 / PCC 6312) TaxID=195253 RepID=UPI0002F3A3CB|nr:hypothetical protein [Synechococcus sp. PCC 6312]
MLPVPCPFSPGLELTKPMDYIEQILETLNSWLKKLVELLAGDETEPALEPIPVPVRDRNGR